MPSNATLASLASSSDGKTAMAQAPAWKKPTPPAALHFAAKAERLVKGDAAFKIGNAQRYQRQNGLRLAHDSNRLSCSASGLGARKCAVESEYLPALRPSFSQAISKRRPIIQA